MKPLSVTLCTHNPHWPSLETVLGALARQSLPQEQWDLVICDSGSTPPLDEQRLLACGPKNTRLVRAPKPGLALARKLAAEACDGRVIAILDDDTVPEPAYLEESLAFMSAHPTLGALSGKIKLSLPCPEPFWFAEFRGMLAHHDHGETPLIAGPFAPGQQKRSPTVAPIGPSVTLRSCYEQFHEACAHSPVHYLLGRNGKSLASGEDNDYALWLLENGYSVGYLPSARLLHLIPAGRLQPAYLARLNRGIQRSWMQVLLMHDASPWPAIGKLSAKLRIMKAWLVYKPWRGPVQRIRYEGAKGHFEGRSTPLVSPLASKWRDSLPSAGRCVYLLWYKPMELVGQLTAFGGPLVQGRIRKGMREMEAAAFQLNSPPVQDRIASPLQVHMLTGNKYWYQTSFCLYSLCLHSGREVSPVIHDDGTLTFEQIMALKATFPLLTVESREHAIAKLDNLLPRDQYPALRERWDNYPHIRKLIDVHLGSEGWKLVLDSDLLFHRNPSLLVEWLDKPEGPLFATDCMQSYGYSATLMQRLCGAPIPEKVNVGICGLASESIDWSELESWVSTMIREERTNYYLEQALTAMLMSRHTHARRVPYSDYMTLPGKQEALAPKAVMHHYVADSKRWYFTHAWKRVVQAATGSK